MKKVIIIGGGVAGLTAGIYCRMNGIECEILEKNKNCGGNLTGWSREGCYIDNCFHWLTGTRPGTELYRIWRDIGMITDHGELYQPTVFYESILDGKSIVFSRYPEVTRLNMLKLSLADAAVIDRFINAVEAVGEFIENGRPSSALAIAYARYRGITLGELGARFKDPLLKLAFTDYFGKEFSAITLIWAYGTFISGNGMIPKGGSKRAAERIESRYIGLGGQIRHSCGVRKIVLDGSKRAKGVITEEGEFIGARAIICACDPSITFGSLLSQDRMNKDFLRVYRNSRIAPRFSSVQAAFAVNFVSARFGTRIISCPNLGKRSRLVVKEYGYEERFAPEGSSIIQTMLFVRDNECLDWLSLKADEARYSAEKKRMSEEMRSSLVKMLECSDGDIKCIDAWTPATYHSYFGADHGSYMGFILTPKTPLRGFSCRVQGLDNVFIASQWKRSPGGLPNAARSGRTAAYAVKKHGL